MNLINTPLGKTRKANFFSPLVVYLIDVFVFGMVLAFPAQLLIVRDGSFEDQSLPVAIAILVAIAIPYLLAYFAHKEKIPSIGYWALGIRRFSFDQLDDYAGKGFLYVKDQIKPRIVIRRLFIVAATIGVITGAIEIIKYQTAL